MMYLLLYERNYDHIIYAQYFLFFPLREYGVATDSDKFTLVVRGSYSGKSGKSGSGSFTACDNTLLDINNAGGSTFEGTDYTCDTKVGTNLPECKPCPGCL